MKKTIVLIAFLISAAMPVATAAEKASLAVLPPALDKKPPGAAQSPPNSPRKSPAAAQKEKAVASEPVAQQENSEGGNDQSSPAESPVPRSFYSAALEEAVRQYKSAPGAAGLSSLLNALKSLLAGASSFNLSPAVLLRDNPYLGEFKPKVIDSAGLRVWTFPRAQERNRALVQWIETHQQTVGSGRRKKVLVSSFMRLQELGFPQAFNLRDVSIIPAREFGRQLLLSGDADDGSLVIAAFKSSESAWVETADLFSQIPAVLTNSVSGRLNSRGNDLILNVAKMIQTNDSGGTKRLLPESESSSYKFLLKPSDAGLAVVASVPDEDAFAAVYQFMKAVESGRTDLEKSMLLDNRLLSLPKYLGLQGRPLDPAARVVEMFMPPGKGQRYRLIKIGKDDLIFDVAKVKGQWQIKAIFVAPPDSFLLEMARFFPPLSRFEPKSDSDKKDSSQESAATAQSAGGAAGGNGRRK